MQIPMKYNRRVDFFGNAKDGVFIELVNEDGITFESRRLTEEERDYLIYLLTKQDNGKAV